MSDEPRELTPEEEAELSRLLAETGGPIAMPADVVARLDATLAELVRDELPDERPGEPAAAPVVPLDARRSPRSPRRWPRMVLAAAAVVVAGYAVGTAVTDSSSSGDAGRAADAPAASADGGGDAGGGSSADESAPDPEGQGAPEAAPSALARDTDAMLLDARVVRLRSDRLEADVSRVLAGRTALRDRDERRELATAKAQECRPPALEPDQRWLPARYDGERAVLVTGPEDDGTVPAHVYGCDGELLASVVVGGD